MSISNAVTVLRRLGRQGSRGYALASVLTLALGIGAVVTVHSLLHAVLLAPLALDDETRVVRIAENNEARGISGFAVATGNFIAWRDRSYSFAAMSAFSLRGANLTLPTGAQRVEVLQATPHLWEVVGHAPLLGRPLSDSADDVAGAVLIGEDLWEQQFARNPAVIGQTLRVDESERTVVGVAPADVGLGLRADLWLPLDARADASNHGDRRLTVVARLQPNVGMAAAQSELDAIAQQLAQQHADENEGWGADIEPVRDWLVSQLQRERLLLMLAAVGLLLLVTCANIASLQIARSTQRRRELGVRQALGADGARVRRDLLIEAGVLMLAGAVTGIAASAAILHGARAMLAQALPSSAQIAMRADVVLIALLACAVTVLAFTWAPAAMASRTPAAAALAGGRGTSGARRAPLRSALVIGQFALAMLLLAGALGLGQRLLQLANTDLGFAPAQVLTARVALPVIDSETALAAEQRSLRRLQAEIAAIPGVQFAAVASDAPLGGIDTQMSVGPGPMPLDPRDTSRQSQASWRIVSSDYFDALNIGLHTGRHFRADDEPSDSVILGRAVAERLFGSGVDPVGRVVTLGNHQRKHVVGVVADTRQRGVADAMTPMIYFPTSWFLWETMTLTVRSRTDAVLLAPQVRSRAASVLPDRPLYDVRPMSSIVSAATAGPRLQAIVIIAFAIMALLIAAVGVGSVTAFLIARRTGEFALRFALGATPTQVHRNVLGGGARLALAGVCAGGVIVLLLSRWATQTLEVATPDLVSSSAVAAAVLLAASLVACWLPARRAASIAPAQALASE